MCTSRHRGSQLRSCRVAAALAVAVLLSPGVDAQKKPTPVPTGRTPVQTVWPLPPDEPRIRYVAAYGAGDDVGADRSPKSRSLKDLLLGKQQGDPTTRKRRTLTKPFGVAVDAYGRMFVTDPAIPGVVVIDPQSRRFSQLGQAQRQAAFRVPIGLAVDARNNVYVGDNGVARILVFGPDLAFRRTIGVDGELESPSGLAVDNSGARLVVADSRRHALVSYDIASGKVIARAGSRGTGKAEFNFPTGVAIGPDGLIYVTDTMNCRVQVFDRDLRWVRSFGSLGTSPGQFRRPKGIAVDGDNVVYVVDAEFNNFQMLTPTGQALLFVGEIGARPGQMLLPAGITIDRLRRRIYVCEQVNARVQVFERVGPPAAY